MNNFRLFVSGGSGLGKSTFAEMVSKKLNLPFRKGQIRQVIEKHPDFFEWSFIKRQNLIIESQLEYYTLNESFVTDRSVLDYIVWTKFLEKERSYKYLLDTFSETLLDSYIVIVPTPLKATYYEVYENKFKEDMPRAKSYEEGILKIYGQAGLDQWPICMWTMTRYLEFEIRKLATTYHTQDKIFHSDKGTNFEWQDESFKWVQFKLGELK